MPFLSRVIRHFTVAPRGAGRKTNSSRLATSISAPSAVGDPGVTASWAQHVKFVTNRKYKLEFYGLCSNLGYSLQRPCHWRQRRVWCQCSGTESLSDLPPRRPRARWPRRSSCCRTDLLMARRQRCERALMKHEVLQSSLTQDKRKIDCTGSVYIPPQKKIKAVCVCGFSRCPEGGFHRFFGSSMVFDIWRLISQELMQHLSNGWSTNSVLHGLKSLSL